MNFEQVVELIRTVSVSQVTAFQYEEGGQKITMQTGAFGQAEQPNSQASGQINKRTASAAGGADAVQSYTADGSDGTAAGMDTAGNQPEGKLVKAPLVGRFYTAPSEDAENFVRVGDRVKKGQVLAIVEAMKLMNEIESDYGGVVTEILAENGQGVEYGQPLFCIAEEGAGA